MCFLNNLIILKYLRNVKYEMWHEYERMKKNMKGKEILVVCKQVCEQACGKLWYVTLVSGDK